MISKLKQLLELRKLPKKEQIKWVTDRKDNGELLKSLYKWHWLVFPDEAWETFSKKYIHPEWWVLDYQVYDDNRVAAYEKGENVKPNEYGQQAVSGKTKDEAMEDAKKTLENKTYFINGTGTLFYKVRKPNLIERWQSH